MANGYTSPDGLELLRADEVTPEELERFRQFYESTKGSQNRSYEFWLEFGPDVVKRHKARTQHWYVGEDSPVVALAALHQYVITAFRDGIEYEIRLAQSYGASRSDILDTLSVAFIHSGHPGMYLVAELAPYLRSYEERAVESSFPDNWSFDRDAFASGMDFGTFHATAADVVALRDWYLQTIGEVPRHVEFLGKHRPDLLKAYRNRYEHAIRESLPKQMLPYLMLHYDVYRGCRAGIRENVLLARAMGMTRTQVLNAICSAVLHGGMASMALVDEAAGDALEGFEDA